MNEHYTQLIEKYIQKTISKEEVKELAFWVKTESSKLEFSKMAQSKWNFASDLMDNTLKTEIWNSINKQIQPKKVTRKNILNSILFYKIAASILLPISIILGFIIINNNVFQNQKEQAAYLTYVEKGQKAMHTLPDGTKVWLNSDTEFSYYPNYNDEERAVYLKGEAYFEVAKNEDKKFIVVCNDLHIEALGTSFNIKNYASEKYITTSLFEGSVKVYNKKNSSILSPFENLKFNKSNNTFNKSHFTESKEIDYWRHNFLYFDSTSLEEIAQIVERMYSIKVHFKSKELKQILFTGTINNNNLNNIFHIISLTYPLKYSFEKNAIVLSTIN